MTKLQSGINVIYLFILQRMLSASKIRVNMGAFASMTERTDAVARIIIMEKLAQVSAIAVIYDIYFHNLLYSGSVTSCNAIPLLYLYINMCYLI